MNTKTKLLVAAMILFTLNWARPAAAENEWPREIIAEGRTVLMYQPQLDKLDGNILYARAAVSIAPKGEGTPVFGAVWLEARIETDLSSRTVFLSETRVPQVHFSEITPEQETQFADLLTREIPTWNITLSQDRMLAMLDIAEKQSMASDGFDDTPPRIIVADQPTVLVNIDGDPQWVPVEGSYLKIVINSPFLIVQKATIFYLYGGAETWYSARDIYGPWTVAGLVPEEVRQLEPAEEDSDPNEPPVDETEQPPAIMVATKPTELINIDGQPQFKALPGNKLTVVENADVDLFMELATQRYFVLLSGRWFTFKALEGSFASKSVKGYWEFIAADALPEAFTEIPAGMDEGEVRTWVAGTEEAKEAVLEASIPQTAAIRRDATISVEYDGTPKFERIKDTSLKYAVNTASQVIQADKKYYCAEQGAWYVANAAEGPWITAIEIPTEILSIPASCPLYNVKFLYIYGYNDDVVYFGYYPGYTNSYVYNETIVYGTGWYYAPWHYRYHYYPRHCTWGYHMRWHRWHGWGTGCRYSTGRFTFSIGVGHRHGWWGPSGYRRGYRHGYNRGYTAAKRDTRRNIYQNKDNANRVVQTLQRPDGKQPGQAAGRKNNVYTDQQGNVMRKNDQGNWETRQNGQWTGEKKDAALQARPESRPEQKPQQQPKQDYRSSLDRDQQARDRGNQRSNSYQQSRSSGRSSGGSRGGGRGGGGGGRR